jgi:hypothetical protein
VNEDRRSDRREREQGGGVQPEHGTITSAAPGGNCGARDRAACR